MTLNATIQEPWTPDPLLRSSGNELLLTLPFGAAGLAGRLTSVRLRQGTLLCKPGERSNVVYFPSGAVISLMACTSETAVEVATIGAEGVVGYPPLLGRVAGATQWMVQVSGMAWRCKASDFEAGVRGSSAVEARLRRYEYSMMIQAVQAAACTSAHRLEQRCARWLLTTHDRISSDRLQMTHEFIAQMLSVRRAGITSALRVFQSRGLIKCGRGTVDIVDRAGLEAAACECYGIVRDAYQVLLGPARFWSGHSISA